MCGKSSTLFDHEILARAGDSMSSKGIKGLLALSLRPVTGSVMLETKLVDA